nr:unnamed protein product [Callosobruchus analis]
METSTTTEKVALA